ncbi:MAG: rhomboid family intramembrane serine protease [Sphingobacteriales bacterium]|nr:rhomboid family intramembrane serine protease [Sphingobacteriales bacterium]
MLKKYRLFAAIMDNTIITYILVGITLVTSWQAFNNPDMRFKMLFSPRDIRQRGEYYRFISSGLIHADWFHLGFNMLALYSFGRVVELYYGVLFGVWGKLLYLLLYFGAMIAGDIAAYFRHRQHTYFSLGASGAVSGVVFAFILFQPWAQLFVFFIPMPAIVAGLLYVGYSYYSATRGSIDGIAHDAHLLGGLFRFFFSIILSPESLTSFIQQLFGS